MLTSMTGYGHGEKTSQTARVSAEIRTVNHRFLDFSIKVPKDLANHEQDVKEAVRQTFSRGRVTVSISAETSEPDYQVKINTVLMERYLKELRAFAKKQNISTDINLSALAALPDVFEKEESEPGNDSLWPAVQEALTQAIQACQEMRQEEGRTLCADIQGRIDEIKSLIARVEKAAPTVISKHTTAFKERLVKTMAGASVDNDRWMTEIAILADKLDFTEEIVRLKSHVDQFQKCLDDGGVVSKRLTYLLQEMHRESATISSKASDADVVSLVVSLKEESEKLREQVQNIE
jgi:uncharacterized protein (TIGR00255 family)